MRAIPQTAQNLLQQDLPADAEHNSPWDPGTPYTESISSALIYKRQVTWHSYVHLLITSRSLTLYKKDFLFLILNILVFV